MVLLPGCKCCGPCWRCHEFNSVSCDNWDAVLTSGKTVTFEYSSVFSDATEQDWSYGFDFNISASETVYFPPSPGTGNNIETVIDGIEVEFRFLLNSFGPRFLFSSSAAWPPEYAGQNSGNHGAGIETYTQACPELGKWREGFRSVCGGFTPLFYRTRTQPLSYQAVGNGVTLHQGTDAYVGDPNDRRFSFESDCRNPDKDMAETSFPEESLGAVSVSGSASMFKLFQFARPDKPECYANISESFTVTEYYSEDFGNLMPLFNTDSLECKLGGENWQ